MSKKRPGVPRMRATTSTSVPVNASNAEIEELDGTLFRVPLKTLLLWSRWAELAEEHGLGWDTPEELHRFAAYLVANDELPEQIDDLADWVSDENIATEVLVATMAQYIEESATRTPRLLAEVAEIEGLAFDDLQDSLPRLEEAGFIRYDRRLHTIFTTLDGEVIGVFGRPEGVAS